VIDQVIDQVINQCRTRPEDQLSLRQHGCGCLHARLPAHAHTRARIPGCTSASGSLLADV